MTPKSVTRRSFLQKATTVATGAAAGVTTFAAAPGLGRAAKPASLRPIRLGGPIFVKSSDPAVLAQAHRDLGYRAAYAPDIPMTDAAQIQAVAKAYAAHDVVISEVGAWCNMMDPDAAKRAKNLAHVEQRLALADELGARCCVNIAGSYDPNIWYGPNPKNMSQEFEAATAENCRKIIDAVHPRRSRFTIEMMPFNFPTGPDDYLRLIKAVDRKAFGVHLDVCNVMNSPERMYHNSRVIRECFSKLGPWIVSCHAKDLKWEEYVQVCLREVIPGRGQIDYKTYLLSLAHLSHEAPLMMEHLKTAEEYTEGRQYIQSVAKTVGVSFGA